MASKVEQVNELADMIEEEMLFIGSDPTEFEDAILGIADRFGASPVIAYDYDKVIDILQQQFKETGHLDNDEDSYISAIEWFEYNIIGAYMGEGTPIYIERLA